MFWNHGKHRTSCLAEYTDNRVELKKQGEFKPRMHTVASQTQKTQIIGRLKEHRKMFFVISKNIISVHLWSFFF